MDLRKQLIDFEGWKQQAYPDPLTHGAPWTIGVGHCGPEVKPGLKWDDAQIGRVLDADIAAKTARVKGALPWFSGLNEPRQAVLIGMCFQMGIKSLLGFVRTLAAMRDERWADAAHGMHMSAWGQQTPNRVNRLAHQIETGQWQ